MNHDNFIPIIGLEVHIELKTKSKMFCGCKADYFGKEPNTLCCPVCLGLPGALPVPNKKAVEWCVMIGLALDCKIPETSKFDRKNYFYPDLPKGYQISQYDNPLAINGSLELKTQNLKLKTIRIRRVHMEEDTGKLLHNPEETLIDFNRSGVPLVEIVTEPDFRNVQEIDLYLKKIQQIVRYLGVSDAEMEKGTMRCEPSISMGQRNKATMQQGEDDALPNYRVEIKNINSFRFARRAIEAEILRQTKILETGKTIKQETRGWSEKQNVTLPQRGKEDAKDYRYFPEPDIPPMRWDKSKVESIRREIPELPDAKRFRFMKDYGLNEYDAQILCESRKTADYFEESFKVSKFKGLKEMTAKTIANWIINKKVDIEKVSPEELVKSISQISQIGQMGGNELEKIILEVLKNNQKAISDYKSGKEQALMFLIGQVMRETKGQANPEEIKKQIKNLLSKGGEENGR